MPIHTSHYYKHGSEHHILEIDNIQVELYAKSANNCGTDNFSKRAVYWLAAKEAAKAGRIDPRMKKNANKSITNYKAKAPQKSEIFSSGRTGQVISVGCWIQRSVKVPSL